MENLAVQKLREQQSKVKERSAPWMVAEQLMDICRREPLSAKLIAQDLESPEMGIVQAEQKIKAFAEAAFVVRRESYEQIEDVHLNILHMLTYYFKTHPECLEV